MFVDVHAFWLARRLSDGVQYMSDRQILSYNQVYLWKQQNGQLMTMARLDHKQQRDHQVTRLGSMQDGPEYENANAAYVAWMPHNVSKFYCDKRRRDSMIASLRLRQRTTPDMTAEKRAAINYWATSGSAAVIDQ